MAHKRIVSQKYVKKQFSIVGICITLYALIAICIPYFIRALVYFDLFHVLNDIQFFFLISLVCLIVGTIFPFFILRKVFGLKMIEINHKSNISSKDFCINFIVYFGLVIVALYLNIIIFRPFGIGGDYISDISISFNEALIDSPLYLFAYIIISPLLEEYAFRGVLLNSLSKYGLTFGLIISSAFYALAHGFLSEMLPSFLMGYLLAKMSLTYKSLRPALFTHILGNSMLCFFALIYKRSVLLSSIFMGILFMMAIIIIFTKKYNYTIIDASKSSKQVYQLFLSNGFVIFALITLFASSLLIIVLK